MNTNRYCVIMAGGVGSRFWPLSRKNKPKQFLDILGTGKSFIRHTFERFLPLVDVSHFIVVTNANYRELVLEQLPEIAPSQVLCEPIGRNTAPCIAYAAYSIASTDPTAEMIVTPADHFITDEPTFRTAISECLDFVADRDALMTVGIEPTRPETGYGYIQVVGNEPINKVKCFTEKPNAQLAETFLKCGEFVWNSGIFIWNVRSIIEAFRTHLPEHHSQFNSIATTFGTDLEGAAISRVFSECKAISIDYGIMEKADNVYVKVGSFGWSDVGTWSSLFDHAPLDQSGNIAPEQGYLYDTSNSIISVSDKKLVVVSGLEDYIVVDTDDVLMICPRNKEQEVKAFTEDIKYRSGEEHL
ncbi:MAG: mannose-1-phosphate guanylyltransferase [Rikenellaceae bacterium]